MIDPYVAAYGYVALYLLFFLGILGMPLPEETLLVFSGFLVSIGELELVQTILVCYVGSISAMTLAYWIGRTLGYPFIEKYGRRFGLGYALYKRTEEWFAQVGKWSLPIGYFIPGVRQFTAYFAGITKLPFPQFALFTYSGGLFWSALFVTLGWQLGARWEQLFQLIARNLTLVCLVLLAVIVVWSWLRGRRREGNEESRPFSRTKEEGTR
ncbi:MAG: DedA family protein [Brevibacillus sp.]|nr:DedA family protein [Brevibacillus sp.]